MKKFLFLTALLISLASCTDNTMARNYGGTETVELKENQVFLNAAWKGDHLWIVSRDTVTGISYIKEKSSWGVFEGTIIVEPAGKE